MVSSKDQAKKISARHRQFCKKFFEDFYAKAEAAGRHPSPLQAAVAFGRILKRETEEEWPPQQPDRPGVSTEVFDLVVSRFVPQGYHEAVEAWYRHTPGLEIKKGKPGRPRKDALAKKAVELQHRGMNSPQIAAELNKRHGEGTTTPAAIPKLIKRFRARTKSNA